MEKAIVVGQKNRSVLNNRRIVSFLQPGWVLIREQLAVSHLEKLPYTGIPYWMS